MDKRDKIVQDLAQELLKGKKLIGKEGVITPLIKQILEAALEGEIDEHLTQSKESKSNRRNGYTRKNLKSSLGGIEIFSPRDRDGSFTPQIVAKRQRLLPGDLDEKILSMYSCGMSYSDIRSSVEDLYGLEVSESSISTITDRIIPAIRDWQSRPLERLYAIIYMDAMHFKIRAEGRVQNKAIYTILGVGINGRKEVLGLYQGNSESASYWMQVLTDLKVRGVEDILISCIDNLKGFSNAVETIFPKTEVQLCVIHQIRNTQKYLSWKHKPEFMRDLKQVYRANTIEVAEFKLTQMEEKWGHQYPVVFKSWRTNWTRLTNYFKYTPDIRKMIYTTNVVEGYHRVVRKLTKSKGGFTSETAAIKLIYLATINANKKWDKSGVHNWHIIFNQFSIYFEDRILNIDTLN